MRHPYVEAGLDKQAVRRLARALGLGAVAELPASPCLSSRVETGLRIEPAVLAAIHAAERFVSERVRADAVRCRVRDGRIVIEIDATALATLDEATREVVRGDVAGLLGARGISAPVSLAAYRQGSAFLRPVAA